MLFGLCLRLSQCVPKLCSQYVFCFPLEAWSISVTTEDMGILTWLVGTQKILWTAMIRNESFFWDGVYFGPPVPEIERALGAPPVVLFNPFIPSSGQYGKVPI